MRKLLLLCLLLPACGSQDTINISEAQAQVRGLVVDTHTATPPGTGVSPLEPAPDPSSQQTGPNGLTPPPAEVPSQVTTTPASAQPSAKPATPPVQIPFGELPDTITVNAPYAPPGAFAEGTYEVRERFLTDQDTFSQWQAMNLTSNGNMLFIGAVDQQTPSKGTVLQMGLEGEDWSDLGTSLLSRFTFGATGYVMEKTIRGLAIDGTQVLISDQSQGVYHLDTATKKITHHEINLPEGGDVARWGSDYVVISAGSLQRLSAPFSQSTPLSDLQGVQALAQHPDGDLYALNRNGIFKVTSEGQAAPTLRADTTGALPWSTVKDFAVDAEGNFFLLTPTTVLWLDSEGNLKKALAEGDLLNPQALIWINGSLYIADAGNSHKDSAILQLQ